MDGSGGAPVKPAAPAGRGGHDAVAAAGSAARPLFRAVFDQAAVGMTLTGADGRYQEVNAAFSALMGLPREELVGREFLSITHPDDRGSNDALLRRMFAGDVTAFVFEKRYLRQDGGVVWAKVSVTRLAGVEPALCLGITEDITARKEAEARLRVTEARLHRAAESGILGLVVGDFAGAVLDANRYVLDLLGYGDDDLRAGRLRWDALTPPEHRWRDARAVEEMRASGVARPYEKELLRKDGSRVPVLLGAARVDEARGAETIAYVIDQRPRQALLAELRAQRAQLGQVLEELPVGVAVAEAPSGRMSSMNRAWALLVGDDASASTSTDDGAPARPFAPGTRMFRRDGTPVADEERPLSRALAGESAPNQVLKIVRADGSSVWVRGGAAPLRGPDGTVRAAVAVYQDISDELVARGQREREQRFLELFIAILGHDLRNPLSAITTTAEMLSRRPSDGRTQEATKRMLSSAQRMLRMINQLLDTTRIRTGQGLLPTRRRVDLGELLVRVIEELASAHPAVAIHPKLAGAVDGSWDSDLLMQVLSNLLGNAVGHGAPDAPVRVLLDGRDPFFVDVQVHNGGAIPPAILPEIFEPFRGSRDRGVRGLGLGLYITQQIVHAHGGEIAVQSSSDAGTTFTVRLPRAAPEATPESPPP